MSKPEIHQANLRWLLTQPADVKIAMLESHLDLCRLLVNEILEEEVTALCGVKYTHDKPHNGRYSRWGANPGSVRIGEHRLTITVPRVKDHAADQMVTLKSYERLRDTTLDEEYLMRGILLGVVAPICLWTWQAHAPGAAIRSADVGKFISADASQGGRLRLLSPPPGAADLR